MSKSISFLVFLILITSVCGNAQFNYQRASLNVLLMDNPNKPANEMIISNGIREIEKKFNNHSIDIAVLRLSETIPFDDESGIPTIERSVYDQKISNKMLMNCYIRI